MTSYCLQQLEFGSSNALFVASLFTEASVVLRHSLISYMKDPGCLKRQSPKRDHETNLLDFFTQRMSVRAIWGPTSFLCLIRNFAEVTSVSTTSMFRQYIKYSLLQIARTHLPSVVAVKHLQEHIHSEVRHANRQKSQASMRSRYCTIEPELSLKSSYQLLCSTQSARTCYSAIWAHIPAYHMSLIHIRSFAMVQQSWLCDCENRAPDYVVPDVPKQDFRNNWRTIFRHNP
ncbi:hypothetical protein B0H34DRAFT_172569 [Crassisporium funariophilum]|nr:hypothetical protein B0H34DRAFT_172569 [Crassisporium funariophilum]